MRRLHLCANCLDIDAVPYPIGYEKGDQRDPVRTVIELCVTCVGYLEDGDFVALREYGRDERVVKVKDNSG